MIWSRLSASCAEANNIINGTVLTVIGYYTGKRISLDLGKLDADMLEALTPDEEADDGDIW